MESLLPLFVFGFFGAIVLDSKVAAWTGKNSRKRNKGRLSLCVTKPKAQGKLRSVTFG